MNCCVRNDKYCLYGKYNERSSFVCINDVVVAKVSVEMIRKLCFIIRRSGSGWPKRIHNHEHEDKEFKSLSLLST